MALTILAVFTKGVILMDKTTGLAVMACQIRVPGQMMIGVTKAHPL